MFSKHEIIHPPTVCYRANHSFFVWLGIHTKIRFLKLILLVKYIFLTTFYGLYFNHQLHITLNNFFMFHGDLLLAAFMCCIYTCLTDLWVLPSCILRIQVRKRLSPLPGFKPTTSMVPSRYTTNRAIQAWMVGIYCLVPRNQLLLQILGWDSLTERHLH